MVASVRDEVSSMKKELEETKKAVNLVYEEMKGKLDDAIYSNTTQLQTDVERMRKDVERLVKHLLPPEDGTSTTTDLDTGDNKDENTKKQLKLKQRCERK